MTEATAVYGLAWWTTRTWAGMRKLHGLTLVDVPKQCIGPSTLTYVVVQVIAEVSRTSDAGR